MKIWNVWKMGDNKSTLTEGGMEFGIMVSDEKPLFKIRVESKPL